MIAHPDLRRDSPEPVKQRLFRLFHFLLSEYSSSTYLYAFLLVVELLQMMYLALHPVCCDLWPIAFTSVLQQVLGFVAGTAGWQLADAPALLGVSCLFLATYIVGLSLVGYEIVNPRLRVTTSFEDIRIKYLQYLGMLSRTVFTIPVISLLTVSIKNSKQASSLEIGAVSIAVCAAVIYLIMTYLFLEIFVDNSPFSKLPWAGPVNLNQKYKTVLKIFMGVITGVFAPTCQTDSRVIFDVVLGLVVMAYFYLGYLQYSEPNLVQVTSRRVYEHSLVTGFTMYFAVLVHNLATASSNISMLYCAFLGILLNFAWSICKDWRQRSLMSTVYKSLNSKNEILSYNYLMCEYIQNLHKQPLCLIKLQGILSDHINSCKKLDQLCNCRTLKQKLKSFGYAESIAQVEQEKKGWFQFIKSNLSANAEKMSHLPQFHLLLSYIEKNILVNNFLSYSNLEKSSAKKMSFSIEFLAYHQKRVIERTFYEQDIVKNERKQVDVNKFLKMSFDINDFQQKVLKSSLEHLEFWKSLDNKKKKASIMKEGSILLQTVKQCERMYNQMSEEYPNNLQIILLFSNYSKYILNNHELIEKNRTLFNLIKKKMVRSVKVSSEHEKQKYSQNSITGAIIISGQKKNVGIIKFCSSKVTNIFKYAPYELVGQNINTLMPNFIGNMHNQVLFKYLEKAAPSFDFVQRFAPMVDKNNFMVLGRIMTKPFPSLLNGLEMIGLVERVKETHIRHGTETPKYILYRCDTGRVEALSQSFYNQYGYRLTKLNQYSEVSEELTFNSLFLNALDSDITNNEEGIECELRVKKSVKKSVNVRVYLRHEIFYFGVKIKLLYLFNTTENLGTYIMNTMAVSPTQNLLDERTETEHNQEKPVYSNNNVNVNVLDDQQLKQFKYKTPFKLKIIKLLLIIFLACAVALIVAEFYFDLQFTARFRDALEHSNYASDSFINLVNIGYYSRMMHIASLFPNISTLSFGDYRNNVTAFTDSLQANQFWLVNKQSSKQAAGFSFRADPLLWQISEQEVIYSTKNQLSLQIFDLVTSSSAFSSALPSSYNFEPVLTNSKSLAKTNNIYRSLLKLRYSTLYEVVQAKRSYIQAVTEFYQSKSQGSQSIKNIELGLAVSFIAIFLLLLIRIVHLLLKSIFSITVLFNWLTPTEINIEIKRCEHFLSHFFINSYEVVLRLEKGSIGRSDSFDDGDKTAGRNSRFEDRLMKTTTLNGNKYNMEELGLPQPNDNAENEEDTSPNEQIDLDKISPQDRLESNQPTKKQGGENEENLLLSNMEGENNVVDQYQSEQAPLQFFLRNFMSLFLGFCLILLHFIGIYLYVVGVHSGRHSQIHNQDLLYRNLETLNALKYYGLEYTVDPNKFGSYFKLAQLLSNTSQQIYQLQQRLNENSEAAPLAYDYQQYILDANLHGVCGVFTNSTAYAQSSYSQVQCQSLDGGVLGKGLRAAVVAYIENILNLATLSLSQSLASGSFGNVLRSDKYLQSALYTAVNMNRNTMYSNIQTITRLTIAWFCLALLLCFTVVFCLYRSTSRDILTRVSGTYQIVSLIPRRIFEKNGNLCAEYRKNVKQLLQ